MALFSKLFIVIDLLLTLLLAGVAGGQLARKADHRARYAAAHDRAREVLARRESEQRLRAQIVPSPSPGRPRPGDLATTRIPD